MICVKFNQPVSVVMLCVIFNQPDSVVMLCVIFNQTSSDSYALWQNRVHIGHGKLSEVTIFSAKTSQVKSQIITLPSPLVQVQHPYTWPLLHPVNKLEIENQLKLYTIEYFRTYIN